MRGSGELEGIAQETKSPAGWKPDGANQKTAINMRNVTPLMPLGQVASDLPATVSESAPGSPATPVQTGEAVSVDPLPTDQASASPVLAALVANAPLLPERANAARLSLLEGIAALAQRLALLERLAMRAEQAGDSVGAWEFTHLANGLLASVQGLLDDVAAGESLAPEELLLKCAERNDTDAKKDDDAFYRLSQRAGNSALRYAAAVVLAKRTENR